MPIEFTLAKNFLSMEGEQTLKSKLRPEVRISSIGIGLGVLLILLSFFIIDGFKREIHEKSNALIGNLRISNPVNLFGVYTHPLLLSDTIYQGLKSEFEEVSHSVRMVTFVDQMALLKTADAFQGVLFHGVDSNYNTSFFQKYLIQGELPSFSTEKRMEVLISERVANKLSLKIGDRVMTYFSNGEEMKLRKLTVVGIFDTGFTKYDDNTVVGDIRLARNTLGWEQNKVGGIEVHLSSTSETPKAYDKAFQYLSDRYRDYKEEYTMFTADEINGALIGWLTLLDANVYLILGLMILVAGMTIITGVVVLILAKVQSIAVLKAMGQSNASLRKTFRVVALYIVGRGILFANIVALLLAGIQFYFKPIKLDPTQYYTSYVPVYIDVTTLLAVNLIVIIGVYLFLLIPTLIIARICPAVALRFE